MFIHGMFTSFIGYESMVNRRIKDAYSHVVWKTEFKTGQKCFRPKSAVGFAWLCKKEEPVSRKKPEEKSEKCSMRHRNLIKSFGSCSF